MIETLHRHRYRLIGAALAFASWLLIQGLGDLTSGQATDPNSGPLIILLALAVIGANAISPTSSRYGTRPGSRTVYYT